MGNVVKGARCIDLDSRKAVSAVLHVFCYWGASNGNVKESVWGERVSRMINTVFCGLLFQEMACGRVG